MQRTTLDYLTRSFFIRPIGLRRYFIDHLLAQKIVQLSGSHSFMCNACVYGLRRQLSRRQVVRDEVCRHVCTTGENTSKNSYQAGSETHYNLVILTRHPGARCWRQ